MATSNAAQQRMAQRAAQREADSVTNNWDVQVVPAPLSSSGGPATAQLAQLAAGDSLGGIAIENFGRLEHQAACILIYGPKDAGKTWLAATVVDSEWGRPALFLDIEGGMRSIEGKPYIQRLPILTWTQFMAVITDLERRPTATLPWRSIVVDNLAWGQELNLQMHTQGYTITPDFESGIWSKTKHDMATVMRKLHDIAYKHNINVIINAWSDEEVKGKGDAQRTRLVLALTPAVAKLLPGLIDMVGYLERDELDKDGTARILSFLSNNKANVNRLRRSQFDAIASQLPEVIYRPSLATIIDLLRGGIPWPSAQHALPAYVRTRPQPQITNPPSQSSTVDESAQQPTPAPATTQAVSQTVADTADTDTREINTETGEITS